MQKRVQKRGEEINPFRSPNFVKIHFPVYLLPSSQTHFHYLLTIFIPSDSITNSYKRIPFDPFRSLTKIQRRLPGFVALKFIWEFDVNIDPDKKKVHYTLRQPHWLRKLFKGRPYPVNRLWHLIRPLHSAANPVHRLGCPSFFVLNFRTGELLLNLKRNSRMQNVLWYVLKHVLHNHLMTRVNFPLLRIVKTFTLPLPACAGPKHPFYTVREYWTHRKASIFYPLNKVLDNKIGHWVIDSPTNQPTNQLTDWMTKLLDIRSISAISQVARAFLSFPQYVLAESRRIEAYGLEKKN